MRLTILFFLLAMLCTSANAWAQAGTCIAASGTHANLAGLKKYYIHTEQLSSFSPALTSDQAIGGTLLGADEWNEHGNAGYFQYMGELTGGASDIPTTASGCNSAGIDYSLVVFSNTLGTAVAQPRCGGNQFRILIRAKRSNGTNWRYGNGGATTTLDKDLPGVIAHEFGHVQGLGHPGSGEAAVMAGGAEPGTFRRHLYEWDFKCSAELSGKRKLTAYKRVHQSSGSFGTATAVKSDVTKAQSGFATGTNWGMGYHRGSVTSWDKGATGTYVNLSNPGHQNGIGFVPGMIRETPTVDRVLYSYWQEWPIQYDSSSRHAVRQISSTNDFATQTADYLYHCNTMTGYFTCSSYQALASPGRIAVGYLTDINRSVIAWLNQDRTDYTSTPANEIWLSVGQVTQNRLAQPLRTGLRSAVAPGIACHPNFRLSYDCILAYVPINDLTLRIRVVPFSVAPSSTGFAITLGPGVNFPTSSRTSGPLAVWWNNGSGKFYVGWRRAVWSQPIGVRSSSDGLSWTVETATLDNSYIAPSVASMFTGTNNLLVYAK